MSILRHSFPNTPDHGEDIVLHPLATLGESEIKVLESLIFLKGVQVHRCCLYHVIPLLWCVKFFQAGVWEPQRHADHPAGAPHARRRALDRPPGAFRDYRETLHSGFSNFQSGFFTDVEFPVTSGSSDPLAQI